MHKDLSAVTWKTFTEPRPYSSIGVFAIDELGRFPILFRGPNIRSARNKWSIPFGLHEVGKTMPEQAAAELTEECNLEAVVDTAIPLFFYENIAPELEQGGDQWHWICHVYAMRVKTLDTFINKEPDKHPVFRIIDMDELEYTFSEPEWTNGLGSSIRTNMPHIKQAIDKLVWTERPQ